MKETLKPGIKYELTATGTHSLVFTEADVQESFRHVISSQVDDPPRESRLQFEGLQQASGHDRVSNTDTPCQVVPRIASVVGV